MEAYAAAAAASEEPIHRSIDRHNSVDNESLPASRFLGDARSLFAQKSFHFHCSIAPECDCDIRANTLTRRSNVSGRKALKRCQLML